MFYSYLDMVLIHYPKAQPLDEKDERNPLHRKLTYLELEKLKGPLGFLRSSRATGVDGSSPCTTRCRVMTFF